MAGQQRGGAARERVAGDAAAAAAWPVCVALPHIHRPRRRVPRQARVALHVLVERKCTFAMWPLLLVLLVAAVAEQAVLPAGTAASYKVKGDGPFIATLTTRAPGARHVSNIIIIVLKCGWAGCRLYSVEHIRIIYLPTATRRRGPVCQRCVRARCGRQGAVLADHRRRGWPQPTAR